MMASANDFGCKGRGVRAFRQYLNMGILRCGRRGRGVRCAGRRLDFNDLGRKGGGSAPAVPPSAARLRICIDWLIHIWISRKSFVSLLLHRRVIAAAVALLLFTKPAVGVFSGGIVKIRYDLVFSTKHLVETTRHLFFRRCSGRVAKCCIGVCRSYKKV